MSSRSTVAWVLTASALLVLVIGCRPARPPEGAVTLNWTVPTEYEDGSPIADLAGYRLYWGQSPGGPYRQSVEIENEEQTSYVVDGLADGEWYFVVTAVSEDLVESRLSNEIRIEVADGERVDNGARVARGSAAQPEAEEQNGF